jgi:hypothetical protein
MPPRLEFLVLFFAGWTNRQRQDVVAYLQEENRVLREPLGERRPRLSDAQRRRLAVKVKALGRRLPCEVAGIVTPDTILKWYRNQGDRTMKATASMRDVSVAASPQPWLHNAM